MILMRRVNIVLLFIYCLFKIQISVHGFTSSFSEYVFPSGIQNKFLQVFLISLMLAIRYTNFIFNHSNTKVVSKYKVTNILLGEDKMQPR